MEEGDDRISKATLRSTPASNAGLSGDRDIWVYTSSTAPIPIVRNEELMLIYAEANIQIANFDEAVKAINVVRNGHGIGNYTGAMEKKHWLMKCLTSAAFHCSLKVIAG